MKEQILGYGREILNKYKANVLDSYKEKVLDSYKEQILATGYVDIANSHYYNYNGEYLGNWGSDMGSTYVGNDNAFKRNSDNSISPIMEVRQLKYREGSPIIHKDFLMMRKATYYECSESTASNLLSEAAAMYSLIENRAKDRKTTELAMFQLPDSNGIPQVRGWSFRNDTTQLIRKKEKEVISGILYAITAFYTDFSAGAYFWHGKDLADTSSDAHKLYYLEGLLIKNPTEDIWNLGSHAKYGIKNNKSWNYKYEVTVAYNKTTFMKLTDEWRRANEHTRNF